MALLGSDWPLLDRARDWIPVATGESGDRVFRRDDGGVYAKVAPPARMADLAGERDRLAWLEGNGIAAPRVLAWRETEAGACLETSAVPGIPASALASRDLLRAWPSIAGRIAALHALAADLCPFDRGLARMLNRATDVVARAAVNADFLADEDRHVPPARLLARVVAEAPARLVQEVRERVVCHGDACLPNIMVDPGSLRCTGFVDLGRLGTADRYADLALMVANARESWTSREEEAEAFAILFRTLGIAAPDRERLAFYLRLDPLTWG